MWQSLIMMLTQGNHHIIVHLLHVDSSVHLEQNIATMYMCHLAVTHRSLLGFRTLLHIAGLLSTTALKNCIFSHLGRLDFQMLSSLCSTGQVFALHDAISLDVVLIHEPRYSKLVTHSRFFPSRLLRLWIWLSGS